MALAISFALYVGELAGEIGKRLYEQEKRLLGSLGPIGTIVVCGTF